VDIPIERVERGLRWLARHPLAAAQDGRVGIIAVSRGAELALLVASTYPELVGPVVAYTPSPVVWPGIDYTAAGNVVRASWTYRGRPLTTMRYVPGVLPMVSQKGMALAGISDRALDEEAVVAQAAIPLERVTGPLLLISGGDDQVWPAARMCRMAVERMRRHGRERDVEHLNYPEAGHGLFPYRGPSGNAIANPMRLDLGGSEDAWRRAHADAWPKVVAVLRDSPPPRPPSALPLT
jgi:pimeloyl-ACP methyl ester carboxylesterase